MPFPIPTLGDLRRQSRDHIAAFLPGADASIPNSVLRVLSDGNAGLAALQFQFLAWLGQQIMPDTAETGWLSRHGQIWLGGRKPALFAGGEITVTGVAGTVLPAASRWAIGDVEYETLDAITIGSGPTPVGVRALTAGSVGNLLPGDRLAFSTALSGVDSLAIVVRVDGGTDPESDDDLRTRVLLRIRKPPMGGSADDYVQWALSVSGMTRAWCSPLEMGPGTVTVRIMMDDLRAPDGLPLPDDLALAQAYLDSVRPVAVKDLFVLAPIPEPIDFAVSSMVPSGAAIRAAVEANVAAMIRERAAPAYSENGVSQPAQTIHREWVSAAILETPGVVSFELTMADHPMPTPGHMATLGVITWV